jgi:hypothetical protein
VFWVAFFIQDLQRLQVTSLNARKCKDLQKNARKKEEKDCR